MLKPLKCLDQKSGLLSTRLSFVQTQIRQTTALQTTIFVWTQIRHVSLLSGVLVYIFPSLLNLMRMLLSYEQLPV